MTTVEHLAPGAWRDAVAAALAEGQRFAAAWADGTRWHVLLTGATRRVLSCDAHDGRVETIVDLVPAAAWDEREAHDLHGLRFDGHEPLRALVDHPEQLERWTTPVSGSGVHQVVVGPIHAGVIESGHFRFHVVGERILALDLRLFHKHRGLERAAAGRDLSSARDHVQRACAACSVANTVAYAQAAEQAVGLRPTRQLRAARTLLLELERLYNHVHDISAICAGVGFAPGTQAFAALKDRSQQLNALIGGHRFLFGAVAVGRGAVQLDDVTAARALAQLRELRADATRAWRDLEFAAPLQARLSEVGILDYDAAVQLGAVGPAARAAGVRDDLRTHDESLWYPGFVAAAPSQPAGDVAARMQMRALELQSTCDILEELLAAPLPAGTATATAPTDGLGIGRVESPRGATTCAVQLQASGRRIAHVHLRTGSYANWPSVVHASAGNLLPDFPLINKSFELCYACVDR